MSSNDYPEGDNAPEPQNSSVSTHHPPRPQRGHDPRKMSAEQYLALTSTPADQMGECTSCNRRRLRAGLLETPTGLQCPHCHGGDA